MRKLHRCRSLLEGAPFLNALEVILGYSARHIPFFLLPNRALHARPDLGQSGHPRVVKTVQAEEIEPKFRVDNGTARTRLHPTERPDPGIRNHVVAKLNLGAFLYRSGFRNSQLERSSDGIQRGGIGSLRPEAFEAVGLCIEAVPVAPSHLDGEEDVTPLCLVPFPARDLDQVKPELRQHWLGDGLQR
jgi:hypothetical protein